ncbi:MAG TPA: molybdate ABC transporter substrate-binding protein [Vicinamibacterales bacterium]
MSAAVSLTDALAQAAEAFEQATGRRVAVSAAASNILAQQLIEGARADLFISADERQMQRVVDAGLVDGPAVPLWRNQLVVIMPAGTAVEGPMPAALASPGVRRIAIGDPAGVPAGVYARDWLMRVNLWREIEDRIVPSASVRAALAAVASGNADAGIVYRTDAMIQAGVTTVYEVTGDDAPAIVYPAAVPASASDPETARRLLAFLRDDERARDAFARAGFILPDPAPR